MKAKEESMKTDRNNILFCSCGRRVQLFKFLKQSLGSSCQIIAADNSSLAPALYAADKAYIVPRIDAPEYIDKLISIAIDNGVGSVTTLIDPEIEILAANRNRFEKEGIMVLAPQMSTAKLCFDKYDMFEHLRSHGIPTTLTYDSLESFKRGLVCGEIEFPVFIKPRTGSGSVGIHKCETMSQLEKYLQGNDFNYIIQEFMPSGDCDADVYIDCLSHKPVAAFSKRKLETKIGGASKTISFKDPELFNFIKRICSVLDFNGPVDMDFWYRDGHYLLSEVNPRFGGAYLHAFGAGVDFFKLIARNMKGLENQENFGNYEENVLMMMYDAVEIVKKDDTIL